jgi:hypothetical protein
MHLSVSRSPRLLIVFSEDDLSGLIDPQVFRRPKSGSPDHVRNMTHPELTAIRTSVINAVAAEIDATLQPSGYQRTGNHWRKVSMLGRSLLQLQKDSHGHAFYINVGTLPRLAAATSSYNAGTPDGFVLTRFGQFCPELPQSDYGIDQLYYVKWHEDAAFRTAVLTVVRERLIPWIEARHKPSSLIALPGPKDMAKTPLFRSA